MMNAVDRLHDWEAKAGAGVDAAGRAVYTGPHNMYMGPGEFAATQSQHMKMKAAAAKEDPDGMRIRELLDQMRQQNLPGNVRLPVFPIAQPATTNIEYHA